MTAPAPGIATFTLHVEPMIEPVLRYVPNDKRLEALIGDDGPVGHFKKTARLAFVQLVAPGLFDGVATPRFAQGSPGPCTLSTPSPNAGKG